MPLMLLTGGGMAGGDLHHLLQGAPLVAVTRTAPHYRLLAVHDRFPALVPVPAGTGAAVEGELYDIPYAVLRDSLLPAEPDELELGTVELAGGAGALAMLLRRPHTEIRELKDISEHGSWRAYRNS